MTRFVDVLEETSRRIRLPQPAKARILLELSADLDDLYELNLACGLPHEDARRRAIEQMRPSDEALAALTRTHTGGFRRFLEGLSVAARTRTERGFLTGLLLFVIAVIAAQLVSGGLLAQATALAWPGVAMACAGLVVGAWRGYVLWVAQDHALRRLRRGLPIVCALAVASVGFAFAAPLLEARSIAVTALAQPLTARLFAVLLTASAATVVIAFMSALLCSMIWYALAVKVSRIERAELTYLLEP